MKHIRCALALLILSGVSTPLFAGDPAVAASPQAAPTPPPAPAEDPQLDALTKLLTGHFRDGSRWLRIAPVQLNEAPRALLAEIAQEGKEDQPEANVLLQVIRRRGEPYLRLFRFPGGGTIAPGIWAAPKAFPDADGSRMDVLTDLPIVADSKDAPTRFSAATASPIPTLTKGAVEMTSEIAVDSNGLTLVEHGFDSEGKEVWQFPAGKPGMFKRVTDTPAGLEHRPSGLVIVVLKEGAADAKIGQPLDEFKVHYTGWLTSGFEFQTSRGEGGQPFVVTIPGGVIQGWNEGLLGMKVGERRRLIVPPALGWGARGSQGIIPPNAWVVFDIELLELKKPDMAPATPAAPAEPPADAPKDPN